MVLLCRGSPLLTGFNTSSSRAAALEERRRGGEGRKKQGRSNLLIGTRGSAHYF